MMICIDQRLTYLTKFNTTTQIPIPYYKVTTVMILLNINQFIVTNSV